MKNKPQCDCEIYNSFKCIDCGACTQHIGEYYMVIDPIWEEAGMDPEGGMLCIGDLERRLGRELEPEDFTDAPINTSGLYYKSPRILDRMGL